MDGFFPSIAAELEEGILSWVTEPEQDMAFFKKSPVEELSDRIATGQFYEAAETIKADDIRRILLSLPTSAGAVSALTPAGVVVKGITIDGRIELNHIVKPGGGPIAPIEFHHCILRGGFSGRHSHFSRLSFEDCRFGNGDKGHDEASLDLSGAVLDSDLDLQGIRPVGDALEGEAADKDYFEDREDREEDDHCWLRLIGTRVAGQLDLSRARLRAPADSPQRWISTTGAYALDLTSAQIDGDFFFLNGGRARGPIWARNAHIGGDMWLSGAKLNGVDRHALMLQLARIGGVLMLDTRPDGSRDKETSGRRFRARGQLCLLDLHVGRSLCLLGADLFPGQGEQDATCIYLEGGRIGGSATFADYSKASTRVRGKLNLTRLRVETGDLRLKAIVDGDVDLARADIHGTVDISQLEIKRENAKLSLKDAKIGGTLLLSNATPADKAFAAQGVCKPRQPGFRMHGTVDLRGLSCDTLDDESGRCWGRNVQIEMNHFVYRQTVWHRRDEKKPSHRIVGDWLLARQAEGCWPLSWLSDERYLPKHQGYLEPWQVRRDWIYQQYSSPGDGLASPSRRRINERKYRPQPFEQAIRVARAEGREDVAVHFEMLKQRIEWRFFNRLVRWWLGGAAIILACSVLLLNHGPEPGLFIALGPAIGILVALVVTLGLMFGTSTILDWLQMQLPERWRTSQALLWPIYFLPAAILLCHDPWRKTPFHFIIAFLVFVLVRWLSVFAHAVMRFGFGYLRRPVRAIITLIIAFLVGWLGVHVANGRDMLVVAAEPVAGLAASEPGREAAPPPVLMGSEYAAGDERFFIREISCDPEISEPLYALDVLVPIVDLREESRCEVRRIAEEGRKPPTPGQMNLAELGRSLPEFTIGHNRFWWLMKALYALAGWFIVSLSILTFAQVNRTRADPE